ncbi:hypothetical protein HOV93_06000 [Planctomycetes bacterium FF15]|uniref:CSD domain-containing protein n=2 Tax=Bremerella alba TaxID=980252 RepID=A0A7V9A605_9BACT|nr:hypothetical protein [Bremerella alba]
MRTQGKITRWDDERGFGFISCNGDEGSVFVHITSFSGTSRRPADGDVVYFEIGKGKNGKSQAERVRFTDEPKPPKRSTGRLQNRLRPVNFAWLFVCFLIASAYFNRIPWLVVGAYGVMSVATFFVYAWDKGSAQLGKWRTAESTLHWLALVGGWPGGLAAQRLLRHKSSKQQFLSVFWIMVTINVVATGYLVWMGKASFLYQMTH